MLFEVFLGLKFKNMCGCASVTWLTKEEGILEAQESFEVVDMYHGVWDWNTVLLSRSPSVDGQKHHSTLYSSQ